MNLKNVYHSISNSFTFVLTILTVLPFSVVTLYYVRLTILPLLGYRIPLYRMLLNSGWLRLLFSLFYFNLRVMYNSFLMLLAFPISTILWIILSIVFYVLIRRWEAKITFGYAIWIFFLIVYYSGVIELLIFGFPMR